METFSACHVSSGPTVTAWLGTFWTTPPPDVHPGSESTIPFAVNESWLEIEVSGVRSRADLRSGLTRLGGVGCDVVMPKAPPGELHVWSDPPKVIHISGPAALLFSGKPVVEGELADGDRFTWGEISLVYRAAQPVLE